MKKFYKLIGISCLAICGFCAVYLLFNLYFITTLNGNQVYQFYGVSAQEGTLLTVLNGNLCLTKDASGFLSVNSPIVHTIEIVLWSISFLFNLISGIVFIRLANKENILSEK